MWSASGTTTTLERTMVEGVLLSKPGTETSGLISLANLRIPSDVFNKRHRFTKTTLSPRVTSTSMSSYWTIDTKVMMIAYYMGAVMYSARTSGCGLISLSNEAKSGV